MKTLLTLSICAGLMLIPGCGDDEDGNGDGASKAPAGPVGAWVLDKGKLQAHPDIDVNTKRMIGVLEMSATFGADGKFTGTVKTTLAGEQSLTGNWKMDGDKLTITGTDGTVIPFLHFDDDKLTFRDERMVPIPLPMKRK
ncbi:MAG: hypothetical protein CMJ83_05380 [Planctomycetes bacterium]|nr:hypothetical protein [Planctomycetota bacterium]